MTRTALIIAHGQPSDPEPAEADMGQLAQRVAAKLSGWTVGAATLAAPDSLKIAVQANEKPLIFPFFMADGWFIRTLLPRRLAEAGGAALPILPPFGVMQDTLSLAAAIARRAASDAGWDERETTLILAAHGSGRSPYPAEAARKTERAIAKASRFAAIHTGFIEEPPYLADAARNLGPRALCLPLFVAHWGHVRKDIPEALATAGFSGPCLDPIGTHADVPALIARSLRAARPA